MNKKSVSKNYIYNLAYQILIIFFPLIVTPYLSRVLGAENVGIFSYTYSIVTYFILIGGLGINLYAQKEIAYVQDKEELKSRKFIEITLLKFITMMISIILFFFIFCLNGKYSPFYTILIIEIIANMIDITWLFQGMEDFKKIIIRNLIIKIISAVLIFYFVKNPDDLKIYFYIYTISNVLGNLSLWFKLPINFTSVKFKELNIFGHLKPTLSLFLPQIAIQIYTVLDKTMLGLLGNNMMEVGYYEYAQKFVQMSLMLLTSIGTVMLPHISNLYSKGKKKEMIDLLKKSFNSVFFIAFPLIFGLLSVSREFVTVFLGNGFDKSSIIICVMAPIILFIGLTNIIGYQYFLPVKKHKEYTISVICGAISNFIFNLMLIPKFNSIGAAIATSISEFVVLLVQMLYSRKDFNYKEVLRLSKNYFIASIIMTSIILLFNLFDLGSFVMLLIKVICGVILYFMILLCMKDKFLIGLLERVKKHE